MIVKATDFLRYTLRQMAEGLLRRIHWFIGIAAAISFLLTGAYMRWAHEPPVEQLDDLSRAVYRSRHIFILLVALANLARAVSPTPSTTVKVGGASLLASAILCLAPVLLTAAFFVEPPLGVSGRSFSTPALYSLFVAAVILALQGRR